MAKRGLQDSGERHLILSMASQIWLVGAHNIWEPFL